MNGGFIFNLDQLCCCDKETSWWPIFSFGLKFSSLYDRRSEELIISYVKTLRFTVGIINKSLIIPTDDLRLTSFGPNDIDNINEVAEINFGLLSKKVKID
jgi:hypothetical protein